MHPRLFAAKIDTKKSGLETAITWHTTLSDTLRRQIIAVHVDSFMDAYRNLSEEMLGLKPGVNKKEWLTKMIESELDEFNKGERTLAAITLNDCIAGYIMCSAVKARHTNLKTDLYIEMLAVKPLRDFYCGAKIQLGLGRQLMDSAIAKFDSANSIILDTRVLNTPAKEFYERIGFNCTGKLTFGDYDSKHYTGFEKSVMRRV